MKKESEKKKHQNQVTPNDKIFHDYICQSNCFLLEFLLKNVKNQSRNNIKTLLSNRQILVNKKTETKFNYELKENDIVTLSIFPDGHKTKIPCPFQILYEDNNYIAINKPSGILSVNLDEGKMKNAFKLMRDYLREINPKEQIFITHRIDKDTSGVLLFTKNLMAHDLLQDSWNELVIKREYVAICEGIFEKKKGTIVSNIAEGDTKLCYSTKNEKIGKKAITHYEVIKENDKLSLVSVNIDTGRKNQIRVHMQDVNHPIVGDKKYHTNLSILNRLGLHARTLTFIDPISSKEINIVSPIPIEFKKLFK